MLTKQQKLLSGIFPSDRHCANTYIFTLVANILCVWGEEGNWFFCLFWFFLSFFIVWKQHGSRIPVLIHLDNFQWKRLTQHNLTQSAPSQCSGDKSRNLKFPWQDEENTKRTKRTGLKLEAAVIQMVDAKLPLAIEQDEGGVKLFPKRSFTLKTIS